ncbi:YfcC family protein [Paralcaligenes sp. KSB-10]|uniref:YfcC family protein n=1 Tax=Paralcaligenes sp. KSB-10 TaxID=2901142 RepID=UPI001E2D8AC2|nr:SLC13 family permease [Paralcaligenes sp. KSB-10]UHL65444.1 YfcC family protein [Paralcaligenes sp. KSB-10]
MDISNPAVIRKPEKKMLHPVAIMLLIMLFAMALTYVLDSGSFQRQGKLVIAGTYQVIPKARHFSDVLVGAAHSSGKEAAPASLVSTLATIPQGLSQAADLIFMVMIIGGMFGIIRKSEAIDTGIDRLLELTRGNVYWLTPLLMLALACGSTFLGLISEYLVLIPVVVLLAERLSLPPLFGVGLVLIAAKIGYIASITNPLALNITQPLLGLPALNGVGLRVFVFVLYLAIGIAYMLFYVRRAGTSASPVQHAGAGRPLGGRHLAILSVLGISVLGLIYGVNQYNWHSKDLSTFYLVVAIISALIAGLPLRDACEAFLTGMKGMVLAGLLIGLASAINIVLKDSLVLDTVIYKLSSMAEGHSTSFAAQGMMFVEMILDVLVPSTSGKAAMSIPILGPIGQLSGIGKQSIVQAFLFGNGLTNMITPTSGMLLAFLAAGKVNFIEWLKFILPLVLILTVLSLAIMAYAISIGY